MKTRSLIIRTAGAAAAAIAISLGGWQGVANAQSLSSSNASAQAQTTGVTAKAPSLSYGAFQAIDMYQRGIRADLIVSYIRNSSAPYQLSVDAIIYMKSLGIPTEIVNAMLQRDVQLREQESQQGMATEQPPLANMPIEPANAYPAAPGANPAAPPPEAGVIPDDSNIPYVYPDYDEYWPPIVIGGGWGWGWGHRWGHGHGDFGRGSHGNFGGGFHGGFGGGHGGGGHR